MSRPNADQRLEMHRKRQWGTGEEESSTGSVELANDDETEVIDFSASFQDDDE
jgi:hypothetical protein